MASGKTNREVRETEEMEARGVGEGLEMENPALAWFDREVWSERNITELTLLTMTNQVIVLL